MSYKDKLDLAIEKIDDLFFIIKDLVVDLEVYKQNFGDLTDEMRYSYKRNK